MKLRILRLCLFLTAFSWAVSVVGVVTPWAWAAAMLDGFGAREIAYDPMLDYWLRMAAGAFTGVGIVFFIMGLKPKQYSNVIGLAGGLMFLEGLVLLLHGLRLGLPPFPFYGDTSFCLFVGACIFMLRKEAR